MPLFLVEARTQARADALLDGLTTAANAAGVSVVEARTTADGRQVLAVLEHADQAAVTAALSDLPVDDIAEVRLVGARLEEVKAAGPGPRYLVEWDLPQGLDMDTYLARKRAKSPQYAQIPEVAFRRTYVREDMAKCLCFYDGSCEDDVRRARKIVDTPVDRLHELR